jgi:hypothetical protein
MTACVRSLAPSFERMLLRWPLTVCSEIPRDSAMIIGTNACHTAKRLQLAGGERIVCHVLGHLHGDFLGNAAVTCMHQPDRVDQLRPQHALEQITRSTRLEGAQSLHVASIYRLNGNRQRRMTIYSPSYTDPLAPAPGSIAVSTIKQFPHSLSQQSTFIAYANAEHDLPGHWHMRANLFWGEDWNSVRINNINAPLVATSVGTAPDPATALLSPRPILPNVNILQYQNSGHLAGNVFSFSVDQHGYKRFGLYSRYAHQNFKADVGNSNQPPVKLQ